MRDSNLIASLLANPLRKSNFDLETDNIDLAFFARILRSVRSRSLAAKKG